MGARPALQVGRRLLSPYYRLRHSQRHAQEAAGGDAGHTVRRLLHVRVVVVQRLDAGAAERRRPRGVLPLRRLVRQLVQRWRRPRVVLLLLLRPGGGTLRRHQRQALRRGVAASAGVLVHWRAVDVRWREPRGLLWRQRRRPRLPGVLHGLAVGPAHVEASMSVECACAAAFAPFCLLCLT